MQNVQRLAAFLVVLTHRNQAGPCRSKDDLKDDIWKMRGLAIAVACTDLSAELLEDDVVPW